MLRTTTGSFLLSALFLLGCPMSSGTRGAVAAAAFGAIAASKIVAAATGAGKPDAKKPPLKPPDENADRKVDTTTPTACSPPQAPPFAGCVSYVAEPHLSQSRCLYFCTDHCTYHPPGGR